jgi:hypothetical protein
MTTITTTRGTMMMVEGRGGKRGRQREGKRRPKKQFIGVGIGNPTRKQYRA